MKKFFLITLTCLTIFGLGSCGKSHAAPETPGYEGLSKVEYTEMQIDGSVMANPERGFYSSFVVKKPGNSPISASSIKVSRRLGKTVYLMEVELDDYISKDIPDSYIQTMQKAFDELRKGGAKAALRFGYSWSEDQKPWDATVEQTLKHVSQLKPLLQQNADVILALQAGFVGVWGEWYYTENFGYQPSSDSDYEPRRKLVNALLDALPSSRQIQLRTPGFKKNILRITYADTLTRAEAFGSSAKARLAGHNDCFLANSSDMGTFDGKADRTFWEADTRYTMMGGETCAVSSYNATDNAFKDLAAQHWTYLNEGYNTSVLNVWKKDNRYNEVAARLGYRFVLETAYLAPSVAPGGDYRVVLKINNKGFAAPMNPRAIEFVWVDASGNIAATIPVNDDPRFWSAGEVHTLDKTIAAPGEEGTYVLCLNLPDPENTLRGNPAYSIRLANKDLWDENTGFNKLAAIKVTGTPVSGDSFPEEPDIPINPGTPGNPEVPAGAITIDGDLSDWAKLPAGYVVSVKNVEGSAGDALIDAKFYADKKYLYICFNYKDVVPSSATKHFHIYGDFDNSDATGGCADQFTDADTECMFEGSMGTGTQIGAYTATLYSWLGEVGGGGWSKLWGKVIDGTGIIEGAGKKASEGVVSYEISVDYTMLKDVITVSGTQMGIGIDFQSDWDVIGTLPDAAITTDNPKGLAPKVKVKFDLTSR